MEKRQGVQRFTVDIPNDLAEALRRAAIAEHRTYRGVVVSAAQQWCEGHGYYRQPRVEPVSAAPGPPRYSPRRQAPAEDIEPDAPTSIPPPDVEW